MTGNLQIKKTKAGKEYFYTVIDYYDANGKRKQKWEATNLPVKGNKKKAEAILRKRLEEYEAHSYTEDSEQLFSTWITTWLDSAKPQIELSTWEGYYYPVQRIVSYFAPKKVKLKDLKPIHFEEYYRYIGTKGNLKSEGKNGLSIKTLQQHRLVINQSLKKAVILGIIPTNPAEHVKVTNKNGGSMQKPLKFLTLDESRKLLDFMQAQNDELTDCVKATLFLGLRKSELLGLTTDSLDFDNHYLHITKTVVKVKTTYEKDRTKTQSSRRSYPLNAEMEEFFKSTIAKKEENRQFYGNSYYESNFLFTWEDGRPYAPDYIYHHFKKVIKKFGRPEITFHDLRHSTASILFEQGWQAKDIQEWLGHADIYTTMNIYTHLSKAHKEEKAKSLEGMFSQTQPERLLEQPLEQGKNPKEP